MKKFAFMGLGFMFGMIFIELMGQHTILLTKILALIGCIIVFIYLNFYE